MINQYTSFLKNMLSRYYILKRTLLQKKITVTFSKAPPRWAGI
jgi:hypothetical protein